MIHTILGAGGPVGNALTKELLENGENVRLVSRRPIQTTGNTTWVNADLKNYQQVVAAVQGAKIIYMCAGLRYDKKVWATEWPMIMQNLINAAKTTGARLIFFDNVYMYGHVPGPMTEETPYNPSSKKGEVRARIAENLMGEAKAGNINASIARAADFYGAESLNSFYDAMVLAKYAKKQKAMWLGNPGSLHSFTYVPDAGKALYCLGQHSESGNQIWHVPTAPALTGHQFIQLAAKAFNVPPKFTKVNKLMLQALGLFNKSIGETAELYYQYQYDYNFTSSKFEKAFGLKPTTYADGVQQLSQTLFKPV
ncbi:NAD-dependent epimerase [Adhaeribacter aerolatus]|uniref:NAD-dependent epimerase n=1 Tax=Adhaeribacter aerolatus TaxID=670289 RepID=A0A512B2E0_9BACT|nr:NAD-dependent epimerase/dehydratase family protein [Adhaeribacter aerolatus]GEO06133.1 NAD-dependent epimerase [Adhaeribacter aerolatus]